MWEKVIAGYCERAGDPGFWAEPLNAVTNAGFVIAGVILLAVLLRDSRSGYAPKEPLSWFLAALIVAIGVGSFLFHTLAVRWTGLADVIPIVIFMFAGVYAVAKRGFDAPIWGAFLAVFAFIGVIAVSARVGGQILAPGEGEVASTWARSLGGVFMYGPAGLVLLVGGSILARSGGDAAVRAAGRRCFAAGLVFAISLAFRTVDGPLCTSFTIGGTPIGTHFLWHLLNAITLYLAATALISLAPSRRREPASA